MNRMKRGLNGREINIFLLVYLLETKLPPSTCPSLMAITAAVGGGGDSRGLSGKAGGYDGIGGGFSQTI